MAGFRALFEVGEKFSDTKHYLYGLACLGEQVDADEPETAEWRYYQRDGKNLVRQTSDQEREVTFAWTYSPTGGVLLGEKGPVTYLDCGDNAIYDWSTGLIFKRNRYFDPANGLWITLGGIVIWQTTHPPTNRRYRRGKGNKRRLILLLLALLLLTLVLAGCNTPTPGNPTPTPCPTPPAVTPGLPGSDTPTPGQPDTPTPGGGTPGQPGAPTPGGSTTPEPPPADTPTVPAPPPPTPEPPPTVPPPTIPPTVDPYGTPLRDRYNEFVPVRPSRIATYGDHSYADGPGIDLVPETHREGGRDAKGFIVVALRAGYATNGQAGLGPNMVEVKPNTDNTGYAIMYSHIVPEPRFIANKLGAEVAQFQVLGTIMDLNDEHFAAVRSCDDHLHLGYRKPAGGNYEDPGFLISQLGPEGLVNDPSPPCSGTPTPIP